jgi:eukaryotic-like serine/threonine-protein kinase
VNIHPGRQSDQRVALSAGIALSSRPSSLVMTTDYTAQAPSFVPPCPAAPRSGSTGAAELAPGERIGEFEVTDVLGRGGFGVVYLARDTSLDRLVALKVSPDAGTEGRNLAQLEHENIVQVYSESVDRLRQQRLLCMQYVPGLTLGEVIDLLRQTDGPPSSGADLIRLLDQRKHQARFEPTALRDRELLEECDFIEAVCLLMSRLSEALAHAHERNILHLDVKPNNILLSLYGRPFLMDFNLSFRSVALDAAQPQLLGGTLAYMSPEHLEAFLVHTDEAHRRLDARTDIYALGVVLFELLERRLPFQVPPRGRLAETVEAMIAERRGEMDERLRALKTAPDYVNRVVRRCLAPSPDQRYCSATALQRELAGCRQLHRACCRLPQAGWLIQAMLQRPWFWLILLGLLPHILGSLVQIAYNATRIVHHLSQQQQELFIRLVAGFNPAIYAACLLWLAPYLLSIYRAWRQSCRDPSNVGPAIDAARQEAIRLPGRAVLVGGVGWLCGALFFPTVLHYRAGGLPWDAWLHFWISFLLAGSIAVAYGFILLQYLILRVMYPRMWSSPADFPHRAVKELARVEPRMRAFQSLAASIPFMGAVILVTVGPDQFTATEYGAFRLLVTTLILSGMLGARLAATISHQISSMIQTLTSAAPSASSTPNRTTGSKTAGGSG